MKPVRDGATEAGAIILAGGEGSRLLPLTRRIAGYDLPKQFCSLIGQATLLEQTRRRISLSIPEQKTVTVMTRTHEQFYAPLIAGIPERNLAIQPSNRDTAAAILFGLFRLAAVEQVRTVAIFPSDHYVSDDPAFMRHVDAAISATPSLDHQSRIARYPFRSTRSRIRLDRTRRATYGAQPEQHANFQYSAFLGKTGFELGQRPLVARDALEQFRDHSRDQGAYRPIC